MAVAIGVGKTVQTDLVPVDQVATVLTKEPWVFLVTLAPRAPVRSTVGLPPLSYTQPLGSAAQLYTREKEMKALSLASVKQAHL